MKPRTVIYSGTLAVLAALLAWAQAAVAGQKEAVSFMAIALRFDPGNSTCTPSGNIHIDGTGEVNMILSDNPLVYTCVGYLFDPHAKT